jgi:hypothetical protein
MTPRGQRIEEPSSTKVWGGGDGEGGGLSALPTMPTPRGPIQRDNDRFFVCEELFVRKCFPS